jgi:two-component system NtrC family response regulator
MARILIVDDEEMDRVLERAILEKAGHELYYAGDGHVALAVCRELDIDLVVTDLAMPEFNGLRFIKELREDGFMMPIIAISGWAKDQLDLAQDYGADLTLFKPVDGDALMKAVQEMLHLPDTSDRADPWNRGRGK